MSGEIEFNMCEINAHFQDDFLKLQEEFEYCGEKNDVSPFISAESTNHLDLNEQINVNEDSFNQEESVNNISFKIKRIKKRAETKKKEKKLIKKGSSKRKHKALTFISFKESKENKDDNYNQGTIIVEYNQSSINRNNQTICNMFNDLNLNNYEFREKEDSYLIDYK